jgi:hypothetical protein
MNGTSHSFGYDSPFVLFALTNNPAFCTALHQRANKTLVKWAAGRFVTAIFVDTSRNTPKYFFQIIVKYYILSFNNNQEEQ